MASIVEHGLPWRDPSGDSMVTHAARLIPVCETVVSHLGEPSDPDLDEAAHAPPGGMIIALY